MKEDKSVLEELNVVPKKKRKLKKKSIVILCCLFILLAGGIIGGLLYKKNLDDKKREEEKRVALIAKINSHYGKNVKVLKDTDLYNDKEEKIGTIYKNEEVTLKEIEIDDKTKFFEIEDLGMVNYEDVEPISDLTTYSSRYKNYLPFNKNVVLKEGYTLYDEKGNKTYSFNKSDEYPILINDYENKYYVEYDNRLMYVLKDDVEKIVDHENTKKKNVSKVTTLCYHRVYDTNEKCTDMYVCKKKSDFDNEMKYLKDNHYFTFTMEEMYLYLTKKLQVEKAILVTLDDGWLIKSAIDVLEKYELNATSFLKTKVWDDLKEFDSPSLELHSHTHDMHTPGVCKKEFSYQQGGGILCLSEEKILNDLTTSREKLNGAIALAYPFYDYNERATKLVAKAGFKMAFIGAGGTRGKASPGVNLYKIPRMTIWDHTSLSEWKKSL